MEMFKTEVSAGAERSPQTEAFRIKGGHVLAAFIVFFIIVFAVNGVMMTLAIRTMPGLDARNGYDPSQRYNADIAAARAQDALGWRIEAQVALSHGNAEITLHLADRDGNRLHAASAKAQLLHPGDRRRDRSVDLSETSTGGYEGHVNQVNPGAWDLVIEIRDGRILGASGEAPSFISRQRILLKG